MGAGMGSPNHGSGPEQYGSGVPILFADYAALLESQDPHVEVGTGAGLVVLQVVTAAPCGAGGSLEFTGPSNLALGQDTYPVRVGTLDDLLFLVPLSDDGTVRTYQAVFS